MSDSAVEVYNANGTHQIVLVCEHASSFIPHEYQQLGLADDVANSHIAWDPGALETATRLSKLLDAVLIAGTVSRLIYDLNRPPESPGAMLAHSEQFAVPGNVDISEIERRGRTARYYQPFVDKVSDVLANHHTLPVLVTLHSFTSVYNGNHRDVEIGVLHDEDSRLADAMLCYEHVYNVQRNQPYGPEDGVTHTLRLHGLKNNFLNVMIEVRNDLISDHGACQLMAEYLGHWLKYALHALNKNTTPKGRP